VGDCDSDAYHVGFAAYRWLLERLHPPLWLHGHTTPASVVDWRDSLGTSLVVNVTGSVVVELVPPQA
jgi:Icc-related predicted phosphoesterase